MKVTLLIPTINELVGLKQVMPRIKREWVHQILIVDGGSRDGTQEYVKENNYQLYVQKRKGLRYAYIEALDVIEGDVVITFSPDGNSLPELIPPLIAKMKEGYDMVIVSRYKDNAKSMDDDLVTGFGNGMFTWAINFLYGSSYTDSFVMFRAWKKDIFRQLDMHKDESYATEERLFHTVVGCEPLLSVRAAKRKLKCADIPGDEPARIGGERKLQMFRWGLAHAYEIIREKFIWK